MNDHVVRQETKDGFLYCSMKAGKWTQYLHQAFLFGSAATAQMQVRAVAHTGIRAEAIPLNETQLN
jgi:hypothetical protein